jgi:hypothetical protein
VIYGFESCRKNCEQHCQILDRIRDVSLRGFFGGVGVGDVYSIYAGKF